MSTETVTQLYDCIATACDDLQEVEEQIEDTNPEAAAKINQIVSNLSGHALNAYNATEYASRDARKCRKAKERGQFSPFLPRGVLLVLLGLLAAVVVVQYV